MEVINATTVDELDEIESFLHDVRFDLPDALFPGDVELSGLDDLHEKRVPIRSRSIFTLYDCFRNPARLCIRSVQSIEVEDHAQVGGFNFSELRFDERRSTVVLESHLGVRLCFKVNRLDVTAKILDDWVRMGSKWRLRKRPARA